MTGRELYDYLRLRAAAVYPLREADAVVRVVLEDVYGLPRNMLLSDPHAEVDLFGLPSPEETGSRLASAEPVQYIAGTAEFCGLKFSVGRGVLVPRPETEELVRWIVRDVPRRSGLQIVDLGTGSGAIAVALAGFLPCSSVTATDISDEALRTAAKNALRHGVSVKTVKADMLQVPDGFPEMPRPGEADAIVSNPPYIPLSERDALHRNVAFWEPAEALFVPDDDPLLFYRAAARWAGYFLRSGGCLWLEVHESYACDAAAFLCDGGWKDTEVREDINSKPRMIKCVKP